jgi:cholinesterase
MVGHNGDEGLGYPGLQNDTAFEGRSDSLSRHSTKFCPTSTNRASAYIASFLSAAPERVRRHVTEVIYPPKIINNGNVLEDYDPDDSKSLAVTGYTNTFGRQTLLTSEAVISCLTYQVNKAFKGQAYNYLFTTPPALHGQELYYVFYNEQSTDVFFRPINVTLAHSMQEYWINFAQSGDPNGDGLPYFGKYGQNSSAQGLSLADIGPTEDPTDNDRCRWWQLGLYV